MSQACCAPTTVPHDPRYRRVLIAALLINAAMFAIEIWGGMAAGSLALQADALDFFGDAANYAISLWLLGGGLHARARGSRLKALSMAGFGLWLLVQTAWQIGHGQLPDPVTMGGIGALALLANGVVFVLLYAWRDGDSNMRSVWLCTRNDLLGNLAVVGAALGVFGSQRGWPDWLVAASMALLALHSAWLIERQARAELRHPPVSADACASRPRYRLTGTDSASHRH